MGLRKQALGVARMFAPLVRYARHGLQDDGLAMPDLPQRHAVSPFAMNFSMRSGSNRRHAAHF
jgi:hypothetical protein